MVRISRRRDTSRCTPRSPNGSSTMRSTRVPLRVELPDGSVMGSAVGRNGPRAPVMRIVDERAFFDRLGADGLIGFGDSFMAGEWDADDPAAVLEPLAARLATLVPAWMQRLRHFYVPACPCPAREHGRRRTAQHRAPLRPVQRSVRALPRRVDDVLVGACSPTATRWSVPSCARSIGCSTRCRSARRRVWSR